MPVLPQSARQVKKEIDIQVMLHASIWSCTPCAFY